MLFLSRVVVVSRQQRRHDFISTSIALQLDFENGFPLVLSNENRSFESAGHIDSVSGPLRPCASCLQRLTWFLEEADMTSQTDGVSRYNLLGVPVQNNVPLKHDDIRESMESGTSGNAL